MSLPLPPRLLEQLSRLISARTGLHFPQERWGDLADGLASAAKEQGPEDVEAYSRRLLSTPPRGRDFERLASHFTIGETYFFREKPSFDALERELLPELIRRRRDKDMSLRIWSAGCCTGEEPYSIAILLDRILPDLADWKVTILATDINQRFLDSAAAGIYGEWSFRAMPPGIRERYFSPRAGGKTRVADRIRRMVTFSSLNLADAAYPSAQNGTDAIDIVLCRNVLMYFTHEQAALVAGRLSEALAEGGWLLVAPSETSQELFRQFEMVLRPGVILYQKSAASSSAAGAWSFPALAAPASEELPPPEAEAWFEAPARPQGLEAAMQAAAPEAPLLDGPLLDARALANGGELTKALAACDLAVEADGLNPTHRFLRAMIAEELGMLDEAVASLERALYLDQDFIMAHFALAKLARRLGRDALNLRHARSALKLLDGLEADAYPPESAGLSAGRLREIIRSTSQPESVEA